MMAIREILNSILTFDDADTVRWVQAELDHGTDVYAVLNNGLIAAMDEAGRLYSQGIFFVPEMLMAAQAMKRGMSVLRPHLKSTGVGSRGCIIIGTVKGDQHDIGKNLVAVMLECAGYKVIDLGRDVETDKFVKTARQNRADLVALSALLSTTLAAMEATVSRIKSGDNAPRTLVGGAPVTQAFADRIGADGFSPDAPGAVAIARRLIGSRSRQDES
jgi:5-methyltetrahydrofolate--homocysteine methyltransferase